MRKKSSHEKIPRVILVCLERWLSEKFSLKTLYFVGYLVYALGCIVNYYVHNVVVNVAMCVTCKFRSLSSRSSTSSVTYLVGMLVVSLNTLPYHMLSNFHADETVRASCAQVHSPLEQNCSFVFSTEIRMARNAVSEWIVPCWMPVTFSVNW